MNQRRARIQPTSGVRVALLVAALIAASLLLLVTRAAAAPSVESAAAGLESSRSWARPAARFIVRRSTLEQTATATHSTSASPARECSSA